MSKTQQLEGLFQSWQKKQCDETDDSFLGTKKKAGTRGLKAEHIQKHFFQKDGIVCEDEYDKQILKVLFLSNEPDMSVTDAKNYSVNEFPDSRDFFTEYYNGGADINDNLLSRICSLYQTISADNASAPNTVANKFAFMNINKRGGDSGIPKEGLRSFAHYWNSYYDEIAQEIAIINPDIIIWCGWNTFDEIVIRKNAKYTDNFKTIGGASKQYIYQIKSLSDEATKQIPILRMAHTSSQKYRSVAKYCELLKNICNQFKNALQDPATLPEYNSDESLRTTMQMLSHLL